MTSDMCSGSGDLGATAPGRFAGNFPAPDAPPTPGPFAAGLARSDGTIPGVGAAMPFSMLPLDGSDHGEQRLPIAASNPIAPHPPSVPHPSLLQPNQQAYQQVPQHVPGQLQHKPLQPPMMPLPPTSLPQLQPPSQLPLLAHPSHLPRPPPIQFPSLSIPASGSASNALSMPIQSMSVSLPLPMPGSASDSLLPRPTSLQSSNYQPVLAMPGQGLQGSATQIPQLSQPPLGMNPMIAGPMAGSSVPPALNNFSNGMTSAHVPSSTAAGQGFVVSGVFGRPQSGQLAPVPGINAYQVLLNHYQFHCQFISRHAQSGSRFVYHVSTVLSVYNFTSIGGPNSGAVGPGRFAIMLVTIAKLSHNGIRLWKKLNRRIMC